MIVKNPEDILQWDLPTLWNSIIQIKEEEGLDDKQFGTIKNGKLIKFDIRKLIHGHVKEFPESNRVNLVGLGKYDMIQYYDDVDFRKSLMRQIIYKHIEKEGLFNPRV